MDAVEKITLKLAKLHYTGFDTQKNKNAATNKLFSKNIPYEFFLSVTCRHNSYLIDPCPIAQGKKLYFVHFTLFPIFQQELN